MKYRIVKKKSKDSLQQYKVEYLYTRGWRILTQPVVKGYTVVKIPVVRDSHFKAWCYIQKVHMVQFWEKYLTKDTTIT